MVALESARNAQAEAALKAAVRQAVRLQLEKVARSERFDAAAGQSPTLRSRAPICTHPRLRRAADKVFAQRANFQTAERLNAGRGHHS